MKKEWISLLKCPTCGGDLTCDLDEKILEEATLICNRVEDHRFKVTNGIPRFVDFAGADGSKKFKTASNFSFQWNKFKDGYQNDPLTMQQFLGPVALDEFADKVILDAGCGMGRYSNIAAKSQAKLVISVDLGGSIDAAKEHNKNNENVFCIQGDIYNLPLKQGKIDLAYSLGVIHHLPNVEKAFKGLYSFLKPGGTLVVWVYGAENNEWVTRFVDPVRIHITSKLPMAILYPVSFIIGGLLWLLMKLLYKPALTYLPSVGRHLFYSKYFSHMMTETFQQDVQTVLDHLLPPYSHYVAKGELEEWIKDLGADAFQITGLREYSWTARVEAANE